MIVKSTKESRYTYMIRLLGNSRFSYYIFEEKNNCTGFYEYKYKEYIANKKIVMLAPNELTEWSD